MANCSAFLVSCGRLLIVLLSTGVPFVVKTQGNFADSYFLASYFDDQLNHSNDDILPLGKRGENSKTSSQQLGIVCNDYSKPYENTPNLLLIEIRNSSCIARWEDFHNIQIRGNPSQINNDKTPKQNEINLFINDLESILNRTKTLVSELYIYKKLEMNSSYLIKANSFDKKIYDLIFNVIPQIIEKISADLSTKIPPDYATEGLDILQSPYLLNFPSAQRSVSEKDDTSFASKVYKQFQSKKKDKGFVGVNYSMPTRNEGSPYYEHYKDWQWPVSEEDRKNKGNNKSSLEKTVENQEHLIKHMTDLQTTLEHLKLRNTQTSNDETEIKIKRIEKQLELLEERNSELYYKKKLLSQPTVM